MVLLMSSAADALLADPYAPFFGFQMAVAKNLYINDTPFDLGLMAFHGSSSNWILFYKHNDFDDPPYDNLSLTVECNGESPVTFQTTAYQDWVDYGVLSIEFPYAAGSVGVTYNSVSFTGKFSRCSVSVADYPSSYDNNTYTYNYIDAEMIPFLNTLEFVTCTDAGNAEISILDEIDMLVTMMSGFWTIAWLVFSILIVVVGVFMVPIFVFILIRWAIYRLSGFRLIERKEDKLIVAE
jgi:hypothetical protein